jgi:hypothetical protein
MLLLHFRKMDDQPFLDFKISSRECLDTLETQDEDKQNTNKENRKDEQHKPHQKLRVNPGTREKKAVPASNNTVASFSRLSIRDCPFGFL